MMNVIWVLGIVCNENSALFGGWLLPGVAPSQKQLGKVGLPGECLPMVICPGVMVDDVWDITAVTLVLDQ